MKNKKIIISLLCAVILFTMFSSGVHALTEDELKTQVESKEKTEVGGNVFIWFLCAIAFLKISQKIDSFMSSLGINVGSTGGSMLGEIMVATKGLSFMKGGGNRGGSGANSGSSSSGSDSFLSGGLAGAVGRKITDTAAKGATGQGNAVGKVMFEQSLTKNSGFANGVISAVATGNAGKTGSITGQNAADSLVSYMNYSAPSTNYTNVEIGGGRMTGIEKTSANPAGIEFGMYNADQYMKPDGAFTVETAADGSQWYKQYAVDTVEKTPYNAPGGGVAYHEAIVQKLPKIPQRKDKV
jgi:hypothetical protein